MAKFIRSLMLPNFAALLVMLIARVVIYEDGIGIQNAAGKTIGWIEILAEDEAQRNEHFMRTAMILNEIINDPKHAVQPDWSYLNGMQLVAPAETAPMPTRTIKKVEVPAEAKTA